jgi:hypothetical protein
VSEKAAAAKLMQILVRQRGTLNSFIAEIEGEFSESPVRKWCLWVCRGTGIERPVAPLLLQVIVYNHFDRPVLGR